MSKSAKIRSSIWIAAAVVAILLTVVGGIYPAASWRFYIQLPGIGVALLLISVAGRFAMMFGGSGAVFLVVVTILTNILAYAAFITLVLVVRKALREDS
jgi:hypothetical protein